jgi:hypothetical protein
MKARLIRTERYRADRKPLSLSAKIALRFIERAIEKNPDDPPAYAWRAYRHPLYPELELRVIENGGMVIGYRRVGISLVSMDMVVDRKDPPEWFIENPDAFLPE